MVNVLLIIQTIIVATSNTYQPAFFHLGECATYQPAIDQSDWPIQTAIVQVLETKRASLCLGLVCMSPCDYASSSTV